ncbi:MAG: hypothetical protein Q7R52_00455 [archaeon]|nr:hypothetical protein [archaeon]
MIKKGDREFLLQLIESIEDAEKRLKQAYLRNDVETFNKIKKFMLQIQEKIEEVIK